MILHVTDGTGCDIIEVKCPFKYRDVNPCQNLYQPSDARTAISPSVGQRIFQDADIFDSILSLLKGILLQSQ